MKQEAVSLCTFINIRICYQLFYYSGASLATVKLSHFYNYQTEKRHKTVAIFTMLR